MTNPSSLDSFCDWLKETRVSVLLQTVEWIIPAVQTVHIVAIAAVVGGALALTLRLLRTKNRGEPGDPVLSTLFAMIWGALPVLLATGALLITAEPARDLENPVFALKMGLLVLAIAATLVQQASLRRPSRKATPGGIRRALAVASLALWVAIVFAGRMIAYVQSL
jgi:uncharacterized protein DUF6644